MLVIPKILEYTEEWLGNIAYGVGLCFALFLSECLKSLSMCSCWVVNQHTGIRFRTAVFSFALEKLIQLKSLTHITMGEVSDEAAGGDQLVVSSFSWRHHFPGGQGREKRELGEKEERERKSFPG